MDVEVLIVGAGPTGLTLAIELARRGIGLRIVDRSAEPSAGSRGDGLQPRTLEVFEDLGVLADVLAEGMLPPAMRAYLDGTFAGEHRMAEVARPTPDVPYPNTWMLPQFRTEAILADRLAALGVTVERGVAVTDVVSEADGVTATAGEVPVRAGYLVGADGGSGVVRRLAGIGFPGVTDEQTRMLLGDVCAHGLDHDHGHWWATASDPMAGVALTPLPGGDAFQFGCPAPPDADASLGYLQELLESRGAAVRLHTLTWSTVWRPNIRLAERFRVGRVLLAGDAAHVHPPTGGQGLNTGVQDGYNLGWKLASVLRGGPESLLDTYEVERRRVAEEVLGLCTRLMDKYRDGDPDAYRRDADTRQLGITYRGGPLAVERRVAPGTVRAGDRAPDAPVVGPAGPTRLFSLLAGTGWTLLDFGASGAEVAGARTVPLVRPASRSGAAGSCVDGSYVDAEGHAWAGYDVADRALVLVRPDGYLGLVADDPGQLPADVLSTQVDVAG